MSNVKKPALSIVIPTFNRWERLQMVLDGIVDQTMPRSDLEIIVVSDGSTDGTAPGLRGGYGGLSILFVDQINQGPAVARNVGVEAATADLVLFLDDDVVPEPECAAVHLESHRDADRPSVVIGPLLTPETGRLQPWVQWEQRMLYKQYRAMADGEYEATARQFYTGNASLAKSVFRASGGFDPSFRRGEDVELAYRLNDMGIHFDFTPEARAFHHAARTFDSWRSIAASYGKNDVILGRDKGQEWILPSVRKEFRYRNPLVQRYTRFGLRYPDSQRWFSALAIPLIGRSNRLGAGAVGQAFLSAIYNMAYYQGMADELGGVDAFNELLIDEVAA